jgi:hypothetical protein
MAEVNMGSEPNGADLRCFGNIMGLEYGVILYKNPLILNEVCNCLEDCVYPFEYFSDKKRGFL